MVTDPPKRRQRHAPNGLSVLRPKKRVPAVLGAALRLVASSRFAVVMILASLAFVLVGLIVPQVDLLGAEQAAQWRASSPLVSHIIAAVGLDRLFSQWYFLAVVVLLGVSLLACGILRLTRRGQGGRLAGTRFFGAQEGERCGSAWVSVPMPAERAAEAVERVLRRQGLTVELRPASGRDGVCSVIGAGGRVGFWGSIAFHGALLVVGTAALVGTLSTFVGEAVLTEGQELALREGTYRLQRRASSLAATPDGLTVSLGGVRLRYERGRPVDVRAEVGVTDGRRTEASLVRVNYPLSYGPFSFLLWKLGHSVRIRIERGGRLLDDTFVNLKNKVAEGYHDAYVLPDGRKLSIVSVPQADRPLGRVAPTPLLLSDPAVYVRLEGEGSGTLLGPIRKGGSVRVRDYVVTFEDARLWASFFVRGTAGRMLLYTGLWVAVLGALIRFADPDRLVVAAVRPGDRRVGGESASEVMVSTRGRYGDLRLAPVRAALARALKVKDPLQESGVGESAVEISDEAKADEDACGTGGGVR